jgi:hypothetical protein
MKTHILIFFLISFIANCIGQNEHSGADKSNTIGILNASLGVSGSSKRFTTNKGGFYVSQSVGQGSVIGTSYKKGYYLVQGYQNATGKIQVFKTFGSANDLEGKVYPNPFEESISILFNKTVKQDIFVQVFNLTGKLVYSKTFLPAQSINLNLDAISSGTYLLKAISNNKLFSVKILKI